MRSNTRSASSRRNTIATATPGKMSGKVMRRNTANAGTPSTRAASYTSRGIICSAARISSAMNGVVFHTSTSTIEASAKFGSAVHAIGSAMTPTASSQSFTMPN
jgi:hypothetical protein